MNGENNKSKIEGWRKMGIAMGTITALALNPDIDFKIAVIMGAIAFYGITWHGVIDYAKKKVQPPD